MVPYRVLIVDDEAIIRKGLIQFIDWQQAGCQVIAEAGDGDEAWIKILQIRPDIVIADIRMPGLDGLELARRVSQLGPGTQVILLTGYADFQYAQLAIRYQVVDFLLKPTQPAMVLAAVARAVRQLQLVSEHQNLALSLAAKCQAYDQLRLEKCLLGLITDQTCCEQELSGLLEHRYQGFYLLMLEAWPLSDSGERGDPSDGAGESGGKPERSGLLHLVNQSFADYQHDVVALRDNQLVVIVNLGDYQLEQLQAMMETSQDMVNLASGFLGLCLNIGLSHFHDHWSQIGLASREAADALAFANGAAQAGSVNPPRTAAAQSLDPVPLQATIQDILGHIREGETSLAESRLDAWFQVMQTSAVPLDGIKEACILLTSLCASHLANFNLSLGDLGASSQQIFTRLLNAASLHALQDILQPSVVAAANLLKFENRGSNSIVVKAMNYLNEHYAEPISLRQLADHVHVSPSYLSRLFHRQTGQTIVEVSKRIRLDQACQLLRTTELKHYEIAERVGIDDPAYFAQLFRKHTGLSPSEYRQRNTPRT